MDTTVTIGTTRWVYAHTLGDDTHRMLFLPAGDAIDRIAALTRPRRSVEPLLFSSPVVLTLDDLDALIVTHDDESESILYLRPRQEAQ